MVFSFNHPLVLLLIPVAVAFLLITARKLLKSAMLNAKLIIALRALLLTILILALSGMGLKRVSNEVTTVFVVDGSESTLKMQGAIQEFIHEALKSRPSDDKVGIIQFGADTSVETTPSKSIYFNSFQTKVNGNFTNIEQALKFAVALIPGEDRKRVVLVTDGQENAGDAFKQARILKHQNVTLGIYPIDTVYNEEVQLTSVRVPENMRLNDKFEIEVSIDSTIKTKGILKLFEGRKITTEKPVEISEGLNRFVFSGTAESGGVLEYSAVIEPDKDTIMRNNSMSAFSYVEDKAAILVVQDADQAASELVKILGDRVNIKSLKPENVPVALFEMLAYDAFIISNVSAERLDNRFLSNLEAAVSLQGKGLLVTGGENSYAVGGYYKTPLENILPVNMDIKPKEEVPNLALVLAIDKSGSMSSGQYGISKLELAKEAAIRSTQILNKDDSIGIIAFDSAVKWAVDLKKADNISKIQSAIGTIRPDGGTQILPPLREAYLALKDSDEKLKHIILLTDGQAEKTGYEPIMEELNEAGITLSTVAVGQEADAWLLEILAATGNGRFYMTDEFSDIPKIFAKETFLAGKTYINNRRFTPQLESYSEILSGINSLPSLDGYVGTTAKSTARVILKSDSDDPVLATWQYGLGRTAAWTSDVKGMWTSNWLLWDESPLFWNNTISWLSQKRVEEEFLVTGMQKDGIGIVEVNLPPDEGTGEALVDAVMVSPSGNKQSVRLDAVFPGAYKGYFDCDETGIYIANVTVKEGGRVTKSLSTGIAVPYSQEYNIVREDKKAFFEKLAFESGGRIINSSRDVFSGSPPPVVSVTDITSPLLILAIVLLILDIVVRRLNISFKGINVVIKKAEKLVSLIKIPLSQKAPAISRKMSTVNNKAKENTKDRSDTQDGKRSKQTHNKDQSKNDQDSGISALLDKKRKRQR